MAKAKDQSPDEVQYYDWRLARWYISETRERLDCTGRGMYRELLDHCYAQGTFPDDAEWISRRCACSVRDFNKWWPVVERHFPVCEHKKTHRYNVFSDIWRKRYFSMCKANRKNGKSGGLKVKKSNDMESGRLADANQPLEPSLSDPSSLSKEGSKEVSKEGSKTEQPAAPTGADSRARPQLVRKRNRSIEEILAAFGKDRTVWWDEFWKIFPCHEGKRDAMDAYERLVKDRELAVTIYRAVQRYAAKIAADPTTKVKWAQGWLNSERWRDEESPAPRVELARTAELQFQPKRNDLDQFADGE